MSILGWRLGLQVKMQKKRERLLPLHRNNKLILERLAEIHRHGGFRPSDHRDAP
jgi:hypothetical protein